MSTKKRLTAARHKKQIDAYGAQFGDYELYAKALRRVMEKACAVSIPAALVQSRPKSISSFAEKCVRKADKYTDAVNDMTDLCGGRVIVQTLEQVKAVRMFIEANFIIIEQDDKTSLLGDHAFGYRDMHYIVQLDPERDIGFTSAEKTRIKNRCAEIQVRTWLQHAWADTLHDRMYKTKLRYPTEFARASDMLAAKMEDGDRTFSDLALEIDGMLANYSVHADKEDIDAEIRMLELILANETSDAKKPGTALQLASLLLADGNYRGAVKVLDEYSNVRGAIRCELLLLLGFSLCKLHVGNPRSTEYQRGQKHLEEIVTDCDGKDMPWVPNLRKQKSLRARAMARLAWTWEAVPGKAHKARDCYREALVGEPDNPYFLADVLGFEVSCSASSEFIECMAPTLRKAIATCRQHIINGTELPYACFVAGRLSLLLKEPYDALSYYARGIRHFLSGSQCVPPDLLDTEMDWIVRVSGAREMCGGCLWVHGLLKLARQLTGLKVSDRLPPVRTLIVAGGAGTLDPKIARMAGPMLTAGLVGFKGIVISGGTKVGLPGCVGAVSTNLKAARKKRFELVGYIPEKLPHDAPEDRRYDRLVVCGGSEFSPEQIVCAWNDILDRGGQPRDVQVLGFGGGQISGAECHTALALGASVGVVAGSGGSADALIADAVWAGVDGLLVLPLDQATVQCFIVPASSDYAPDMLDSMGRAVHAQYVANSTGQLPANMKPWSELAETYKVSNREQARFAAVILETCGFSVEPATTPKELSDFTDVEIERMAELEHGRWNVDRLRNGWRPGRVRDNGHKIHNCIVPWNELPEDIKHYDRSAVIHFPAILAKAGLEIRRKRGSKR